MSVVVSIYSFTFDISSWKGITIMCIFCCLICSHIYWIIPTTQWENVSTECIYGSMYFLTCTVGHFIYFHMYVYITLKHLGLFMWRSTNHLVYYCFISYVQQEFYWYTHISCFNSNQTYCKNYYGLSRIMHWILDWLSM